MERMSSAARYADLHEEQPFHDGTFTQWSDKRTAVTPVHFNEGVTIWVADEDLSPHDHFLGGAKKCPECRSLDGVDEVERDEPQDDHEDDA